MVGQVLEEGAHADGVGIVGQGVEPVVVGGGRGTRRRGGRFHHAAPGADGETRFGDGGLHIGGGAGIVDFHLHTGVGAAGEAEEEFKFFAHGGQDGGPVDAGIAARLDEFYLNRRRMGDPQRQFDLLGAVEGQRLLGDDVDADAEAVQPRHPFALFRRDGKLHEAAARGGAMQHGEHGDQPLLQAVAAVDKTRCAPSGVEDGGAFGEHDVAGLVDVVEVGQGHSHFAVVVRRRR